MKGSSIFTEGIIIYTLPRVFSRDILKSGNNIGMRALKSFGEVIVSSKF